MISDPGILWFLADWRLFLAVLILAILVFGAAVGGTIWLMFSGRPTYTGITREGVR